MLAYKPEEANINSENRNRKCLWYNPPFNKAVSTNIAKKFLALIDKHFPREHKFYKLFNRNNVKVSYSCTQNIKNIISSHNKKILRAPQVEEKKSCNCSRGKQCPLDGKCKQNNIVYEATIESNIANYQPKTYIGSCSTTFKERFGNHKQSIENKDYSEQTSLSKECWKIKDAGGEPTVSWKIAKLCRPCTPMSCDLCTSEKLLIAKYEEKNLINKKNEMVSKCRHVKHFMLANFEEKNDVIGKRSRYIVISDRF